MDKTNYWQEELNRLAEILDKSGLEVMTKWGAPVYTRNGKNIVSFAGFKHHFSLWFQNGVFLKDPYNVLISSNDKTKALRQWRFSSMDEIDEKKILEYVKEAVQNSEEGKELKPEKFKPVPVPELLQNELDLNKELKSAFEKLTPGKQKEYNLYIEEAKQEATKQKRIKKITPMILQGIGLNDKYKNC
ncbi:MAG TPA: YdeI/OmpD-associated family protein [Aquaticitalea sp.]|nr:YdeI/OmpD-associated family protein [Aquaticitalea sp.]